MFKNIGFTGTRAGMTEAQKTTVIGLLGSMYSSDEQRFHHGDCVGADAQASHMADGAGYQIVIHPPIRLDHRAFCSATRSEIRPPKHYLERNRDIVKECEVIIATPKENCEQYKGGTWYTINYALLLGKDLHIVWPDGSVKTETGMMEKKNE